MDEPTISPPGEALTCRICRSEGNTDEPLFHPCRCSGSIRNVHQECLVEWLSHSQKKHCELCKTPFRFTKLYDAHMPNVLPWDVFIQQALVQVMSGAVRIIRALLVTAIWLVVLPWIIRWAWRWMFWFADAGWARDIYFARLLKADAIQNGANNTRVYDTWDASKIKQGLNDALLDKNATASHVLYDYASRFLVAIGIETFANTTHFDTPHAQHRSDASIFSSLSYISALTPYPAINRILLDIFEGQLITCLVILSFILIFLIREWVVQQQPVVNLDLLNQQRELEEDARRQLHRLELLEQARRTLEELEQASAEMGRALEAGATEETAGSSAEPRRPQMPDRDASSRAIKVQRLIEEADAILGPADPSGDVVTTEGPPTRSNARAFTRLERKVVFAELPITNAGPDAKLNIAREIKGKATKVPAPRPPPQPLISNEELEKRLSAISSPTLSSDQEAVADVESINESRPANTETEDASLQQEQAGTTTGPTPDVSGEPDIVPRPEDLDMADDLPPSRPEDLLKKSTFEKLADWFWADIEASPDAIAVVDNQERLDEENMDQAPFVPVHRHAREIGDPEVVAAAQQAGLDAEQADDADDIEGILELIGLQGPIAALLQTSLFCLLLVVCTVACAVVLPYIWGKLVLSFVGSPFFFLVMMPLQVASAVADFGIDLVLFTGGWALSLASVCAEAVFVALHTLSPRFLSAHEYAVRLSEFAMAEANASGNRLRLNFVSKDAVDPLGINAGFLGASVHSHLALKDLQAELSTIVSLGSGIIRGLLTFVATGQTADIWQGITWLRLLPITPTKVYTTFESYLSSVTSLLDWIRSGGYAVQTTMTITFDPELVYWSSTDRTLAVCAGYAALALLATIYVAADRSITRSGQKTEKLIRDSLRQAGGVFKVILIISIEMLVFPFYCGLLLDLAFLPLFREASLGSRLSFASSAPYVFCFVHWFVGTCYMFHFALFVGMCRKILRKGVLWFIRDPDDPTFHPVRDVLERNVTTQLRKIAFSALVYGALVILCLGGVIWGIGKVFNGIFPIYFIATEPTIEFPLDLLLYNFATPLIIRFFRPSKTIHAMYAWWLKKCARLLRLSHFLFDDRRLDEEGHNVAKPWASISRFLEPVRRSKKKSPPPKATPVLEPGFEKDGQYVLTPCNDQYRPPKRGEAFLHVTDDDVYIANKDGTKNDSFAKVYIPPLFKSRVTMFMVCLWIFSAFSGLGATLLPLVLGRQILHMLLPNVRLNDIYAYSLGAYTMAGGILLLRTHATYISKVRSMLREQSPGLWLSTSWKVVTRISKLVYVYGFTLILLPLMLGIIMEMHVMVPLHACFSMANAGKMSIGHLVSAAEIMVKQKMGAEQAVDVSPVSGVSITSVEMVHTIHIIQDLALGIFSMRIIGRTFLSGSGSRALEAMRRASRNGKFNPDAWIATRFLIAPSMVLGLLALGLPPILAVGVCTCSRAAGYELSQQASVLLFRFSFPILSTSILVMIILREIAKATKRWRARIRDEVYLVGERLHNFGEKRPPSGSRSVMRRSPAIAADI